MLYLADAAINLTLLAEICLGVICEGKSVSDETSHGTYLNA